MSNTLETLSPPSLQRMLPKVIPWVVAVGVIGVGALAYYGNSAGWFDGPPTRCADFSASALDRVFANSMLGKMGAHILAVESISDVGSNQDGLRCRIATFTTRGDITFSVTTKVINGSMYIQITPQV